MIGGMRDDWAIGDVVRLKKLYHDREGTAIIINIHSAESPGYPGKDGWISFDYVILTEDAQIMHVSSACIAELISREI